MKIQKRKFLSNLSRIKIFQQNHPQIQRILLPFQYFHALFLCSFMIMYSNMVSGNTILSFIKQANQGLSQGAFIPLIFSLLLIIISLFIIIPLLLLSEKERELQQIQQINKRNDLLFNYAAIFSSVFNYLAPFLITTIIAAIQIKSTSTILITFIHILAVLSSQVVILFFKGSILYSYKLTFLSFSLILLPPFQAYFFIFLVTINCLKAKIFSFEHEIGYTLTLLMAIVLMIGEQTLATIGEFHLVLLLTLTVAIKLSYKPSYIPLTVQCENDFLLKMMDKLGKEEELQKEQIIQIIYISQICQSKLRSFSQEDFHMTQKFDPSSCLNMTKSDVMKLLRSKLEIDIKLNANNAILSIQRFEYQLLGQPFSIDTLYQIQKLNLKIQESSNYDDICRIEALIHKLEVNFLNIDDEINSSLIFKIQKQMEKFYDCIGEGIEQLLAMWKTILVKEVDQHLFENSIAKMIRLETESLRILQQLSKYKDMNFQKSIFNYWRKITNVNTNNYFNEEKSKKNYKLADTTFLLISNGIIKDASHTVAKKITSNKEELLIGLNISEVLYDFYSIFLQRELNTIISIGEAHKEIVIPFKIINHDKRFMTSSCTFKILPNLSQGVKYIINFLDRKDDLKKYALYCMESDTIEGFSQTFYEKFKIDESILPEIISGQDVFNTAISAHIIEEKLSVGMTIRCELKFNDLRKQIKSTRAGRHSIPLMVTICQIYQVKKLNYLMLELTSREETVMLSAYDTIKQMVGCQETANVSYENGLDQNFCKIRNPLESVIDDKLSRINAKSRISYFKIVVGLMSVAIILLIGTIVLVSVDTNTTGEDLHHQLDELNSTNVLIQQFYYLFYQYYQHYQIKNYPEQILSIQYYDVPAINKQYKSKSNTNIVLLLPLILNNDQPQQITSFNQRHKNYLAKSNTKLINFVSFLEATKTSLATNQPSYLVQNFHIINKFIGSFDAFNSKVLQQFRIRVKTWAIVIFVVLMLLCLIIRIIHFRITIFKWSILKVYQEITQSLITKYSTKLEDFVNLLVRIKYYNRQNPSTGPKKISLKGFSTRDTFGDELFRYKLNVHRQEQVKGVKFRSKCSELLRSNFIFLVPMVVAGFMWIYYQLVVIYDVQSNIVLDYFSNLQDLTVLMLRRATQFFQASMEAAFPSPTAGLYRQQGVFTIPSLLHQQLPSHFQNYKKLENQMLGYNLCDYSYLNTGSLYKGLNCSVMLDGMMNRGFTETYAFLLQSIENFRGVALPELGTQLRQSARYPFYMEVCYARRTINNMLAVVQSRFTTAIYGYLEAKQTSLHSIMMAGLVLLPLAMGVFWAFARRLWDDCQKAIKCFRILPRSFIMKISISKKLLNLGALQQIQLVAA